MKTADVEACEWASSNSRSKETTTKGTKYTKKGTGIRAELDCPRWFVLFVFFRPVRDSLFRFWTGPDTTICYSRPPLIDARYSPGFLIQNLF
jgi:hypothetical protein